MLGGIHAVKQKLRPCQRSTQLCINKLRLKAEADVIPCCIIIILLVQCLGEGGVIRAKMCGGGGAIISPNISNRLH